MQLVLVAIFHMGNSMHGMQWHSYQAIAGHPLVKWAVPVSVGDSHHGFPVLGTTPSYFDRYQYGDHMPLRLDSGRVFANVFEAVIGADLAEDLGYRVGDKITLTHGNDAYDLGHHEDKPFVVSGILARTGTPVDRTVHVGLDSIEAIHLDWQGGAPIPGASIPAEYVRKFDLTPKTISAVLVGLHNRASVFRMQLFANDYRDEALVRVLPGVAADEIWQIVGVAEHAMLAISGLVFIVGLAGLVAVVLAGLGERRRELAILRAVGARPRDVFVLLSLEAVLLALVAIVLAVALLCAVSSMFGPMVQARFGIALETRLLSESEWILLAAVIIVTGIASVVPGYYAYRLSLADGLSPRI